MPEINKILYETDLSPNSAYALRFAYETAEIALMAINCREFDVIVTDYKLPSNLMPPWRNR